MTDAEALSYAVRDSVFFGRVFLGWQAHPGQVAWLQGSRAGVNFNRSGNRWGKTESIAVKHLWKCAFRIRPCEYGDELPYASCNASCCPEGVAYCEW